MIIQRAVLVRMKEPVSVLSFVIDMGPLLLLSLLFSAILFYSWYFGVELSGQRKKQRLWLSENKGLIQQYKFLNYLLDSFGQHIASCKNCKNDKMQLWDYKQDELLVVRCRSCKMNYTFTKDQNDLIQLMLSQIEGVVQLVNTVFSYRYQVLGKLLIRNLAIDLKNRKRDFSPLAVLHFTASKKKQTSKSVKDIFLNEWEVVFPDKTERLAS